MPQNYVPIFIFIAIVGSLLPITLLLAKLVRPSNPSKTKLMPYECGIDPIDSARGRYTVRYYIIAILFVVFDVETIFLFPWAVKFKAFGLFGLLEMLIFLAILIVGYIWVWKKARWNGFRVESLSFEPQKCRLEEPLFLLGTN
jgi:NADH-quinone oxidoreductase subunit A